MKTTKTWKQKTKSVGLAAVIGLATVGAAVTGSATPATAQEGSRMCMKAEDSEGNIKFFERRTYNSCSGRYFEYSNAPWKWVADLDGYNGGDVIRDGIWSVDLTECENFTKFYLGYTGDICFSLKAQGIGSSPTFGLFNLEKGFYTVDGVTYDIGEAPPNG